MEKFDDMNENIKNMSLIEFKAFLEYVFKTEDHEKRCKEIYVLSKCLSSQEIIYFHYGDLEEKINSGEKNISQQFKELKERALNNIDKSLVYDLTFLGHHDENSIVYIGSESCNRHVEKIIKKYIDNMNFQDENIISIYGKIYAMMKDLFRHFSYCDTDIIQMFPKEIKDGWYRGFDTCGAHSVRTAYKIADDLELYYIESWQIIISEKRIVHKIEAKEELLELLDISINDINKYFEKYYTTYIDHIRTYNIPIKMNPKLFLNHSF